MCFSATASFGTSAVLGVIGIVAIAKAKTNSQRLFAIIPLIFSVQQLSEGVLWLSLKNPEMASWQPLLTGIYLVFAMVIWPIWIPLTIRLLEKEARPKKIMNVLIGIGACVAVCVGIVLFLYPVQVKPMHHHLHYEFGFPQTAKNLIGAFTVLYIIASITPAFVSGIKKMKWLGIAFLASYLFAVLFYEGFVVSVWCFFAAILSVVVLWIIHGLRKPVL
jgi:hypothetical protein